MGSLFADPNRDLARRIEALETRYDEQFADLGARYGFGFSAFDNAQVRHATSDDPMFLVFGKK